MAKLYTRINWENDPSIKTPLNADNLNKMDKAIDDLDDKVEAFGSVASGSGPSYKYAYIVGQTEFAPDWLSETFGGGTLTPEENTIYVVRSFGDYYRCMLVYDGDKYMQVGTKLNRIIHSTSEEFPVSYAYNKYGWYAKILYQVQIPNDQYFAGKFDINLTKTGKGSMAYFVSDKQVPDYREIRLSADYRTWGIRKENGDGLFTLNSDEAATYTIQQKDLGRWFSVYVYTAGEHPNLNINGSVVYTILSEEVFSYNYTPKTEMSQSLSGFIPGCNSEDVSVFLSDGQWHTLGELKQMLSEV